MPNQCMYGGVCMCVTLQRVGSDRCWLTPQQFVSQLLLPHNNPGTCRSRYMIAEGKGQLWLCFAGTKHARDILADADFVQSSLWGSDGGPKEPAAHRGFLARSNAIPIKEMYEHARASGLHLVLCGATPPLPQQAPLEDDQKKKRRYLISVSSNQRLTFLRNSDQNGNSVIKTKSIVSEDAETQKMI
eukprot:scaffold267949_cov19-Prasinocladus_malaysianus.AAC.1